VIKLNNVADHYRTCTVMETVGIRRWLQLRFDFDSTLVRRAFDYLSKVIKFTATQPASRSHADLFI